MQLCTIILIYFFIKPYVIMSSSKGVTLDRTIRWINKTGITTQLFRGSR
jgi:hypothetical protein